MADFAGHSTIRRWRLQGARSDIQTLAGAAAEMRVDTPRRFCYSTRLTDRTANLRGAYPGHTKRVLERSRDRQKDGGACPNAVHARMKLYLTFPYHGAKTMRTAVAA